MYSNYTSPHYITCINKQHTNTRNNRTHLFGTWKWLRAEPKDLTRNLHWLDLRLLLFLFRHSNSKHPIFHTCFYLINFSIFRKPEPPHELPRASFNTVPSIIFLFLLSASLSANLQHLPIFHFHLHFLLLQPGKVHAEHVSLRRLLPVHPSVGYGTAFTTRGSDVGQSSWERKSLKRVPYIERERVEDVASFTTEEARDERHRCRYLDLFWFWWKLFCWEDIFFKWTVSDAERKMRELYISFKRTAMIFPESSIQMAMDETRAFL